VTQEHGILSEMLWFKDKIINNADTICLLDQTKFKDQLIYRLAFSAIHSMRLTEKDF